MVDKKERKAQKKAFKKARRKYTQPWKALTIISLVVALVTTPLSIVFEMFDNILVLFLGGTFWEVVDEDPNANYFTSEFATDEERIAAGAALGYQMEAEGASLLMNENDALPLASGSKVSLFSISSVSSRTVSLIVSFAIVASKIGMEGIYSFIIAVPRRYTLAEQSSGSSKKLCVQRSLRPFSQI